MKDCRIYLLTMLFLCLSVVKLCFPALSAQIGQEVSRTLCSQTDYTEALQTIGRAIGRGQLVQVLNELLPNAGEGLIHTMGQERYDMNVTTDLAPQHS